MKHPHRLFFILVLLFCLFGLMVVFNASVAEAFSQFGDKYYFFRKQLQWFGLGTITFIACSLLPVGFWKKFGPVVFLIGLIGTFTLLLPGLGRTVQGAQRWHSIGAFTVQPSEFLKLGIVLYFPLWLEKHQRLTSFMLIVGLIIGMLMLQPDMGTALVTGAIAFGLYIGAGASFSNIAKIFFMAIVAGGLLILIAPYRMERVTTFLKMESDPLGASYHIRQITIALGSGGWFGQGLGQSKQKYQYIPEASTDSIYAIIGEELGFVGGLVVFVGYGILFRLAFAIVQGAHDAYSKLLGLGVCLWLASQVLLNLAAVVSLVPLTGIPLPFISYGGSSLLTMLAGSGILVAIGKSQEK